MDRRTFLTLSAGAAVLAAMPDLAFAAGSNAGAAETGKAVMTLPAPDKNGGKPLMQALNLRRSTRTLSDKPLSEQQLGDLLWATWGVNRTDGKRTAPTAKNLQDIELYVALPSGIWRYEGRKHVLELARKGDERSGLGGGAAVLGYVARPEPYTYMAAGSLYQNAGLYCASVGLGNVVRANGASTLQGFLKLPEGQKVLIIQSVGFPK